MRAWRVHEFGPLDNLRLEDIPRPEPGPNDVVIRIRSIGLNSSELQIVRGMYENDGMDTPFKWDSHLPRVPGIEGAGEVAAVGSDVTSHKVGDRVTVSYWFCCGECDLCRSGIENMCSQAAHFDTIQFGRTADGAYAEYARVPAPYAVPIPDGLAFQDAAALTVAGGTAANMLFAHADIRADETVLVTGAASNIGVIGLQLAKMAGARRIVATAGSDEKLRKLEQLGADATINHTETPDFAERAIELNGGEGFDIVYDVPGGSTISPALHSVKPRGRIVLAGYMGGKTAEINLVRIIIFEARILGSASWTRPTLSWVLDLGARKRIRPVIDTVYDFEQLPEALGRLERREVFGKVIVNVD
ncbi:quinone oxidoreductase family protein [Capillimicrobium parvum]|uniref:Alcohol dehydrogenase n=1 Tax=Capillimicrobium parvum TaxID=2884022 RepID=A0A9E6XW68_9ACTN|nr:zinc-binding dehydrogenase [Capillimicrobium parvum]UGS35576.1 Alcohol dehydrogenase [Capillimicrobium parvum]